MGSDIEVDLGKGRFDESQVQDGWKIGTKSDIMTYRSIILTPTVPTFIHSVDDLIRRRVVALGRAITLRGVLTVVGNIPIILNTCSLYIEVRSARQVSFRASVDRQCKRRRG